MIVVFDMDHVVSDAAWRDGLLGDWDAYHAAGQDDRPVAEIVRLVDWFRQAGLEAWIVTAREEKWREATVSWLIRNEVRVDELLMRPDGDYGKAPELKARLLRPHASKILLAVDDKEDVCDAYRSIGVLALTYFSTRTRAPELTLSQGAG